MDIDRALEALLEKKAAAAIDRSVKAGGNEGAGLRALRDTDSVSDLTARLFSDPRVGAYAQALVDLVPDADVGRDELIDQLDEARMTTPLWNHQREALERWHANGQRGYVDMATATGKTVLGLAALALRYGALHPNDFQESDVFEATEHAPQPPNNPKALIVAGTGLLLDQWRSEFDEHLDIPEGRTTPTGDGDQRTIKLEWGEVEFRTAQGLLDVTDFTEYDLVILDEAHRYTRGSSDGRRWRDLFEDMTDGVTAVLAMSGSVDGGWTGDSAAENALESNLDRCSKFGVAKARREGVIADFSWQVRYLPVTGEGIERLASQTRITTANYDSTTGILDTERLDVSESALPHDVVDYDDLRSFVQSNDGSDLRKKSTAFDSFASALLARKPLRWNLSPDTGAVAELVAKHGPEQKTVVLVRSYEAAADLKSVLSNEYEIDTDAIVALTDSSDNRYEKVEEEFNDGHRGIIIGPGDLLGMGVNMPDAEIAINVSRGGVNASLVQRIGRVLRNPTGDKEAFFYHLVAQPVDDDAIDYTEDGARLLERAAEFRALGATFRETPTYRAHEKVGSTLVKLENRGVDLLERIDDEDRLVDESDARELVRTLQAAVYDANEGNENPDDRPQPVVEQWVIETDDSGETDRLFPERNQAYERYRLSLGPYRAAKAIAKNLYDTTVDIDHHDGRHHVEFGDKDLSGTEFHNELERWLNSYRDWRDHCDNRAGDGEPGSLPQYKSEWPEPPSDKGVMLPREAVDEIGISYADADPIFFPYVDGDLYSLPLPDGRYLTVEGIVDDPAETGTDEDPTEHYTVNSVLLMAAQSHGEDIKTVVSDAVAKLLKKAVDDDSEFTSSDVEPEKPRTELPVDLSDRHERLLHALADESSETNVDALLDMALRHELAIEESTISIEVDGILADSIRSITEETEYDSVEAFVLEAAEKELLQRLQD